MKKKELLQFLSFSNPVKEKQYKYLWSKMQEDSVIYTAWRNLRKGKTKRKEVKYIDAHYYEESQKIKKLIRNTVAEHPEKGYNPPKKRKTKIVHEYGKKRIAHLASIREQWYFHIIVVVLEPIVMRRISKNSCGCIPGRGAHSGKRTIEKWIKSKTNVRYFFKGDVRHFYDSIHIDTVIKCLRKDISDERFLYCIAKIYRHVSKGILIGLYISPWLANYVLADLDQTIESIPGVHYIRYVDDIVIFANSKRFLHKVKYVVKYKLGKLRLKLKGTYQVIKFDYKKNNKRIGRPLDFMGFQFYSDKTIIRFEIMLRATRAARRLKKARNENRRYYIKSVRGLVSRMGWFKHTDSYFCYRDHIKPFVNIKKLKKIVSDYDKEDRNDRLERRTLPVAA